MVRWSEAVVTDVKILDHLLSRDHPLGSDKAAFFELLTLSRRGEVVAETQTPFGIK